MQCPKCGAGSSVSTTIQLDGGVKRHRRCGSCANTFITMESVIKALPKGRPAKQKPVPDERGLFKKEDVRTIKREEVETRRKNADRVPSYFIEDDYE